jgi:hypothetical protein
MHVHNSIQSQNLFHNILPHVEGSHSALGIHLNTWWIYTKLHVNEAYLRMIPSSLSFVTSVEELNVLQVWEMGLDIRKAVEATEHLRESRKNEVKKDV